MITTLQTWRSLRQNTERPPANILCRPAFGSPAERHRLRTMTKPGPQQANRAADPPSEARSGAAMVGQVRSYNCLAAAITFLSRLSWDGRISTILD